MKYWIRLFMLIGAICFVFAAIGWVLPHDYALTATIEIDAPSNQVYQQIDSTPKWKAWTQWNPDTVENLTVEYGADGKSQSWTDVRGDGKLWFVGEKRDQQIDYRMRFANFPEMNAAIVLEPTQSGTKVTWTSEGTLPKSPFYGFFRHIFVQQMHLQYMQSLEKLKQLAEKQDTEDAQKQDAAATKP